MKRIIKFRVWDKKYKTFLENHDLYFSSQVGERDFNFVPYEHEAELQQFTGLTDKNGKEIYEGDILQNKNIKGEVIYSGESLGYFLKIDNESPYEYFTNKFKIIGNIFENPELLNK